MTELITALGELAFASRIRRLAERLMQDISLVYREQGLAFEPRWFLLFYELGRSGPLAVTDLAARIGVTHPAVNQLAAELLRKGLLIQRGDSRDKRRRLLGLSPAGKRLLEKLRPVWDEIRAANADLLAEAESSLLTEVGKLERLLDQRSMYQRVNLRLKQRLLDRVEIVPYRPQYRRRFKTLNLEWLEKCFTVESRDLAVLNDPEREIIGRGGRILFARCDGEIIGTCAIVPEGGGDFELIKMAVDPAHRGLQAGRKLALAAIAEARQLGGARLIARTSVRLEAAVRLYRSLGFEDRGSDRSGDYQRPTIVLVLELKITKPKREQQ
jgi:DNA-binding MarR family transcriptional regulator/predicted GNAT family N-acyltransferase